VGAIDAFIISKSAAFSNTQLIADWKSVLRAFGRMSACADIFSSDFCKIATAPEGGRAAQHKKLLSRKCWESGDKKCSVRKTNAAY
jgi:hypothetical protein